MVEGHNKCSCYEDETISYDVGIDMIVKLLMNVSCNKLFHDVVMGVVGNLFIDVSIYLYIYIDKLE